MNQEDAKTAKEHEGMTTIMKSLSAPLRLWVIVVNDFLLPNIFTLSSKQMG